MSMSCLVSWLTFTSDIGMRSKSVARLEWNRYFHVFFALLEVCLVEPPHSVLNITLVDHEREIDARRAERNQRDVDLTDRGEDARRHTRRAPQAFANDRDNRAFAHDLD